MVSDEAYDLCLSLLEGPDADEDEQTDLREGLLREEGVASQRTAIHVQKHLFEIELVNLP